MFKIVASIILFLVPSWSFSQDIDILILNNRYNEALEQIDLRIKEHPTAELFSKKGLIYSRLHDYQNAILAYEKALELEPYSSEILCELGESNSVLGNNQVAVTYFEKALGNDTTNLPLAGKLGKTYINLKEHKSAYDVFSKIYSTDSTNVYWNRQLAYCASKLGKKDEAITLYEKVLTQNPKDLSTCLNLAKLYQIDKQYDLALRKIYNGMRYFKGNSEFLLEWAEILFFQKEYAKAQYPYEQLLEKKDSTYNVLKNYGICLYFTQFENEALGILEKCSFMTLNDPIVLFYISLCHKKLKQYEVSEGYMKSAIEAATPYFLPEMYHHLGQIYGQQREFKESIEVLKKSYKLDGTNFEVLFEIATTYEEYSFNKTLALNYYREYIREAGEEARNLNYALDRIRKIKEELFFEE